MRKNKLKLKKLKPIYLNRKGNEFKLYCPVKPNDSWGIGIWFENILFSSIWFNLRNTKMKSFINFLKKTKTKNGLTNKKIGYNSYDLQNEKVGYCTIQGIVRLRKKGYLTLPVAEIKKYSLDYFITFFDNKRGFEFNLKRNKFLRFREYCLRQYNRLLEQ